MVLRKVLQLSPNSGTAFFFFFFFAVSAFLSGTDSSRMNVLNEGVMCGDAEAPFEFSGGNCG
jgi:hypothetical protein